jgi:hypothetical protein
MSEATSQICATCGQSADDGTCLGCGIRETSCVCRWCPECQEHSPHLHSHTEQGKIAHGERNPDKDRSYWCTHCGTWKDVARVEHEGEPGCRFIDYYDDQGHFLN